MERSRLILSGLVAVLAALVMAGPASAQFSLLPDRGFSVDGRRGALITTVDPARISQRVADAQGRALAGESGNRGEDAKLLLAMPETEAALMGFINELDAAWPHERGIPPRARVTAAPGYGAQAFPDGSIVLDVGLLADVESDDELALILGHELAHLRLGHFADDAGFRRTRQMITALGQVYTGAAFAEELRLVRSGDEYRMRVDDRDEIAAANARANRVARAVEDMTDSFLQGAWQRNQEDEADALGVDLTLRLNLNAAQGANLMLERYSADFQLRQAMTAESVEVLTQALAEISAAQARNNLTGAGAGDFWQQLGRSGGDALRQRAIGWALRYFGQRHRTPDARRAGITRYIDRAYPDADAPDLATDRISAIKASAEFQEARVVSEALATSDRLVQAGQFRDALVAIDPALKTRYRSTATVANRAAAVFAAAGEDAQAIRLYEIAHASPDQTVDGYYAHAALLARLRRFDRAGAVIDRGVAHAAGTQDPEKLFLPLRVGIAFQRRQAEEGMTYLRRCVGYRETALEEACISQAIALRDDGTPPTFEEAARIEAARREMNTRTMDWSTIFSN